MCATTHPCWRLERYTAGASATQQPALPCAALQGADAAPPPRVAAMPWAPMADQPPEAFQRG